jgi:hypothetical protein
MNERQKFGNATHILTVMGILDIFNISKKLSNDEIVRLKKKLLPECSTRFEMYEMLKDEIIDETNEYIKSHYIPGLLVNPILDKSKQESTSHIDKKKINIKNERFLKIKHDASQFAMLLQNNKKFSKDELLFFIISLVNALELTEEDFDNFNKRVRDGDDFEEIDGDDKVDK